MHRVSLVYGLLTAAGICAAASAATVTLTAGTKYQEVDGFGSMETIDAWKIKQGPFYYTVDLAQVGFYDSIARDMQILRMEIPQMQSSAGAAYNDVAFTHAIQLHQRGMTRFFGACWSPPGWMKSNGSETGGGSLLPEYYDDFGRLCAEYARQFKQKVGIDLYAISLQNEPRFSEPYASCQYSSATYRDLTKVAGPIIGAVSPTTKLLGPEDVLQAGGTSNSWVQAVLGDAGARPYFGIYGVHCHGMIFDDPSDSYLGMWNTVRSVADPNNLPLWMSETGDSYDTSWSTAVKIASSIANSFKYGNATAWIWFTFAKAASYSPMIEDGVYSGKYYQMAHFGRFVKLGARRIESAGSDAQLMEAAFQNVDGSIVVVIANPSGSAKTLSLAGAGLPGEFRAFQSTSSASMMRDMGTVATGSSLAIPATSITTFTSNTTTPVQAAARQRRPAGSTVTRRLVLDGSAVVAAACRPGRVSPGVYSLKGEVLAGRAGVWHSARTQTR